MKLSNRKLQRGSKIQLAHTSMIDVVFLLLIFFLTTSSFVRAERELDPAIQVQRTSPQQLSDLEPVIVDVVTSHQHQRPVFRLGGREFTDADELTDVLRHFEHKMEGAFVRVADDVPFGMAATAVQACKRSGFAMVSYIPLSDDA